MNPNQSTITMGGMAGCCAMGTEHTGSLIRDQVTRAESLVEPLRKTLEDLEARLDTVITPLPPTPKSTLSAVSAIQMSEDGRSHLLGRLCDLNEQLLYLLDHITQLVGRVEV